MPLLPRSTRSIRLHVMSPFNELAIHDLCRLPIDQALIFVEAIQIDQTRKTAGRGPTPAA